MKEIFQLFVSGLTIKEISSNLNVNEKEIRIYLAEIFSSGIDKNRNKKYPEGWRKYYCCLELLETFNFYKDSSIPGGFRYICKSCHITKTAHRVNSRKIFDIEVRENIEKKKKDITKSKNSKKVKQQMLQEIAIRTNPSSNFKKDVYLEYSDKFKDMIFEQENKCMICKEEFKNINFAKIDHCHKTGKIRGLLCNSCNTAIGLLKEKKENFISAMMYLNINYNQDVLYSDWVKISF